MAALVKFIDADGQTVWVNPDQVQYAQEHPNGTLIVLAGTRPEGVTRTLEQSMEGGTRDVVRTLLVRGTVEETAMQINGHP